MTAAPCEARDGLLQSAALASDFCASIRAMPESPLSRHGEVPKTAEPRGPGGLPEAGNPQFSLHRFS